MKSQLVVNPIQFKNVFIFSFFFIRFHRIVCDALNYPLKLEEKKNQSFYFF